MFAVILSAAYLGIRPADHFFAHSVPPETSRSFSQQYLQMTLFSGVHGNNSDHSQGGRVCPFLYSDIRGSESILTGTSPAPGKDSRGESA